MAKRKSIRIKVGRDTWTARDARLLLDDDDSAGGFNHPEIRVEFRSTGGLDGEDRKQGVMIEFQRNAPRAEFRGSFDERRAAYDIMDTRQRWTVCYGASVQLSRDARSVPIVDRPFAPDLESALAMALARILGRTIATFNLHAVHPACEALRAKAGLETLGLSVEVLYRRRGSAPVTRWELTEEERDALGANRRHRAAEEKNSETAASARERLEAAAELSVPEHPHVTKEEGTP